MASNGNGSHSICSFASSSQYAFGKISERVDSVWPIFTKLGPRSSSMARKASGVKPFRKWCFRRISDISLRRRVRVFRFRWNRSSGSTSEPELKK